MVLSLIIFPIFSVFSHIDSLSNAQLAHVFTLSQHNFKQASSALQTIDTTGFSTQDQAYYIWLQNELNGPSKNGLNTTKWDNNDRLSFSLQCLLKSQRGSQFLRFEWSPQKAHEIKEAYEMYLTQVNQFSPFESAQILFNYAMLLFAQGYYNQATQITAHLAEKIKQQDCSEWRSQQLNQLVLFHVVTNSPEFGIQAGQLAQDCIDKNNIPPLRQAILYNNLGQLHISNANYYSALHYENLAQLAFEQAGEFAYEWFWHMGWLYSDLGKLSIANDYILEAIRLIDRAYGPTSYDGFLIRLVLLKNQIRQQDTEGAKRSIYELSQIEKVIDFGPDYQSEFILLKALFYKLNGDNKKVIPLLEQSLQLRKEFIGPKSVSTISSYNQLIQELNQSGQIRKTQEKLKEAITIIEKYYKQSTNQDVLDLEVLNIELNQDTNQRKQTYEQMAAIKNENPAWHRIAYNKLAQDAYARYLQHCDKSQLILAEHYIDSAQYYLAKSDAYLRNFEDKNRLNELFQKQINLGQAIAKKQYMLDPNPTNANNLFYWMDYQKQRAIRQNIYDANLDNISGVTKEKFNAIKTWQSELYSLQQANNPKENGPMTFNRVKVDSIEQLIQSELKSLAKETPTYYNYYINEKRIEIEDLQSTLRPKQAMVFYEIIEDELVTILIRQHDVTININSANNLPLLLNQLASSSKNFNVKEYKQAAFALYQLMILPIAKKLPPELFISLDNNIHTLNVEQLISEDSGQSFAELNYLVNNYTVTYILSGTSAYYLQQKHKKPRKYKAAFFAPVDFNDDKISQPFIAKDIVQMSQKFNGQIFKGEEATVTNFLEQIPKVNYLFVGSHTFLNTQNPMSSKIIFYNNQPVYAHQIYQFEQSPEVVVLASCSTHSNQDFNNAFTSIANGFFYSGSKNILCTLRDVDEQATSTILSQSLSTNSSLGINMSKNLRKSKLYYLQQAKNHSPDAANPLYWSSLVSYGINHKNRAKLFWLILVGIGFTFALTLYSPRF